MQLPMLLSHVWLLSNAGRYIVSGKSIQTLAVSHDLWRGNHTFLLTE